MAGGRMTLFKLLFITIFALILAMSSLAAQAEQPVGEIVKTATSPQLFIMVPVGRAALIPSPMILQCLRLQNRRPVIISDVELNRYPKAPLLLRSPSGTIYRIDGNRKLHITSQEVFLRLNYDPVSLLSMLDDQLACIPDGPLVY